MRTTGLGLVLLIALSASGQSSKILDIKEFVKRTDSDIGLRKTQSLDYQHPIFDSIKIDNGNIVPLFDANGLRKVTLFNIGEGIKEEWRFYYNTGTLIYFDHSIIEYKKITTLTYQQGQTIQGEKFFLDNREIIGCETMQNSSWVDKKLTADEKEKLNRDIFRISDELKRSLRNN